MVEMGENAAPSATVRTIAFFWGTVKTEYATSEAIGCSLTGSALGRLSVTFSGASLSSGTVGAIVSWSSLGVIEDER